MKKTTIIIFIVFITLIYILHTNIMMGMYFKSSWLFISDGWSSALVHSYQETLALILLSYILFLFSILKFVKLKRKITFSISILFCILFFFLSGQYVTITDTARYDPSDTKGYQNFQIAEKFSIIPIRSFKFKIKTDTYKYDYQDKFFIKIFPTPQGRFWVINGLGFCFRLHDDRWSLFHLMYHQGKPWPYPKGDYPEYFK